MAVCSALGAKLHVITASPSVPLILKTSVRNYQSLQHAHANAAKAGQQNSQTSWEEAVLAFGCLPKSQAALAYTCKSRQQIAHQIAARGPVWAVIYRDCLCTIQPYFAAWVRHVWPLLQQSHMLSPIVSKNNVRNKRWSHACNAWWITMLLC